MKMLGTKNMPWRQLISISVAALIAFGIAGCARDDTEVGPVNESPPVAGPPVAGTGSITVRVTDYFDQPVAGARVAWYGPYSSIDTISDEEGNAWFPSVRSGDARVCAFHSVRGSSCGPEDPVTVPVDGDVELARKLTNFWSPPLAAVLETNVDLNGLSPDGRTLDITIRVAVTQPPSAGSWFYGGTYPLSTADCVAREGQELADLGPRCIRGPGGTDTSYAFGGLNGPSETQTIDLPLQAATVGLLLDESAAFWDYEENAVESRIFAAKIFADQVLPDTGLLLAGFASDDPAGVNPPRLPQTPVTFFPANSPGLFLSGPEIFAQFDGLTELSGGVAPLYAAILPSIDFIADQATPGTRRMLVVLSNGRDDTCGTAPQCATLRSAIAARSRDLDVELILVGHAGMEAMSALAVEASAPLLVGDWYSEFHGPLDLVRQLLGESVSIEDVRLKLTSDEPGAFYPGAAVNGELWGDNASVCPFDCQPYVLPFSVRVP